MSTGAKDWHNAGANAEIGPMNETRIDELIDRNDHYVIDFVLGDAKWRESTSKVERGDVRVQRERRVDDADNRSDNLPSDRIAIAESTKHRNASGIDANLLVRLAESGQAGVFAGLEATARKRDLVLVCADATGSFGEQQMRSRRTALEQSAERDENGGVTSGGRTSNCDTRSSRQCSSHMISP
jgi:hypothetical protein